jgi:hypothetical protein
MQNSMSVFQSKRVDNILYFGSIKEVGSRERESGVLR